MGSVESARMHGVEVMAKLQFGTAHELGSVPNLPLLGNVFTKADTVRRLKLAGFMGCWNFGNMVTANTLGFNAFLSGNLPGNREEALMAFARQYFTGCDAGKPLGPCHLLSERGDDMGNALGHNSLIGTI